MLPILSDVYTRDQATTILDITAEQFTEILDAGFIPKTSDASECFPKAFVDNLAALLRIGASHGNMQYDIATIELYYLRHAFEAACTPFATRANRRQRQAIRSQCAALVETHKAVLIGTLYKKLEVYIPRVNLAQWAQLNKIMTVRIGQSRYVSVAYLAQLAEILSWPTIAQVAARLKKPITTIAHHRRQGKYTSYKTPDRLHRINPSEVTCDTLKLVENFAWLDTLLGRRETLTYPEVAKKLGCGAETVARWCLNELLPTFRDTYTLQRSVPEPYITGYLVFVDAVGISISRASVAMYRDLCTALQRIV